MKVKSTKSPYKDEITQTLEKRVAVEFADYMEQHKYMEFDELLDNFDSNVIEKYNNRNDKKVGFSIEELSDSAYKIDVWYW